MLESILEMQIMPTQKILNKLRNVVILVMGVCCIDDLCHRLGLGVTAELSNIEFLAGLFGGSLAAIFGKDFMKTRTGQKLIEYLKRSEENKRNVENQETSQL